MRPSPHPGAVSFDARPYRVLILLNAPHASDNLKARSGALPAEPRHPENFTEPGEVVQTPDGTRHQVRASVSDQLGDAELPFHRRHCKLSAGA